MHLDRAIQGQVAGAIGRRQLLLPDPLLKAVITEFVIIIAARGGSRFCPRG